MSDDPIKVDITRAKVKISKLREIPELTKKKLMAWGSLAVYQAKRNASGGIVGKYKDGRKTGQLHRNIAMKLVEGGGGDAGILIGTGPQVGTNETKYASILEHGGIVKPTKKKYLAIPLPGIKGVPANYPDAFVFKAKSGKLFIAASQWRKTGKVGKRSGYAGVHGSGYTRSGKLQLLFLLAKEAKIPAFHWLSGTINPMLPELYRQLAPQVLVDELLGGLRTD